MKIKDLIYREDAIKAINLQARIPHDVTSAHYANMVINAICSVPSANRQQGEWIVNMLNHESICSLCGAKETEFIYGTETWYGLGESRFCPSCGRRMNGAKGAEEIIK